MMKVISVLDTTICDYNLGNQIIMESVYKIIDELFIDDFLFRFQFDEKFESLSTRYFKNSAYVFWVVLIFYPIMNICSQLGFNNDS
ncbi:MAG: hypothetical protein NC918_07770 [Candidatus Omnitrophica bacterium]|nr:hypothetical protein [Candidatus Omnitrophota bacterium]